jgi:putative transposase
MSRKYKFHNKEGLYFVSFAVINWIDVFVRDVYSTIITDSLNFCIKEKGMELYCWCLMPSHVHLIFRDKNSDPSKLLKEFKTFTSKKVRAAIETNSQESRKEWMLAMMKEAGDNNSNVHHYQFWQQHNQPIELWSAQVIEQKADYIHNNPVEGGFVVYAEDWKYSSAVDYSGGKGLVNILFL